VSPPVLRNYETREILFFQPQIHTDTHGSNSGSPIGDNIISVDRIHRIEIVPETDGVPRAHSPDVVRRRVGLGAGAAHPSVPPPRQSRHRSFLSVYPCLSVFIRGCMDRLGHFPLVQGFPCQKGCHTTRHVLTAKVHTVATAILAASSTDQQRLMEMAAGKTCQENKVLSGSITKRSEDETFDAIQLQLVCQALLD